MVFTESSKEEEECFGVEEGERRKWEEPPVSTMPMPVVDPMPSDKSVPVSAMAIPSRPAVVKARSATPRAGSRAPTSRATSAVGHGSDTAGSRSPEGSRRTRKKQRLDEDVALDTSLPQFRRQYIRSPRKKRAGSRTF
jgi:hypothetical protein